MPEVSFVQYVDALGTPALIAIGLLIWRLDRRLVRLETIVLNGQKHDAKKEP